MMMMVMMMIKVEGKTGHFRICGGKFLAITSKVVPSTFCKMNYLDVSCLPAPQTNYTDSATVLCAVTWHSRYVTRSDQTAREVSLKVPF
jgi:hypothetical protein